MSPDGSCALCELPPRVSRQGLTSRFVSRWISSGSACISFATFIIQLHSAAELWKQCFSNSLRMIANSRLARPAVSSLYLRHVRCHTGLCDAGASLSLSIGCSVVWGMTSAMILQRPQSLRRTIGCSRPHLDCAASERRTSDIEDNDVSLDILATSTQKASSNLVNSCFWCD